MISTSSAQNKINDSSSTQNNQQQSKFDYLKAKYVFRYPFTFTSVKWAFVLGTFLGVHSFIRNRNAKMAFNTVIQSSFILVFPIWAFFMGKYEFYQSSIQAYEQQESQKIRKLEQFKNYARFKLKLDNDDHEIDQEQLMERYSEMLRETFDRNNELSCLLENVNDKTFDLQNAIE